MLTRFDWWLILIVVLLLALDLTVLTSINPPAVTSQLLFAGLAGIVFLAIARTDYRLWKSLALPLYILSLLLLLLTLGFGQTIGGASRWLALGPLQFQPSEIVKPLLVLCFAAWLETPRWQLKSLLLLTAAAFLPIWLIFRQPDLGTSLMLIVAWASLIFAAGLPIRIIAIIGLFLSLSTPFVWKLLQPYQRQRVITFLNPAADPLKTGYQAIQAMITIGSGQLLGRGLGRGTQTHLQFLPEKHTDFIFASLAEELGFLGGALTLLLFFLLLWRILAISRLSRDRFGRLICLGVFSLLFSQVFVNVGMNLGLLPITGVTLPLLSVGGSSLLATLMSLGLVESVALRRQSRQDLPIKDYLW